MNLDGAVLSELEQKKAMLTVPKYANVCTLQYEKNVYLAMINPKRTRLKLHDLH